MPEKKNDKQAAAKPAAAEKAPEAPHALVAKFKSNGHEYTILRLPRELGDKLKKGAKLPLTVKDGVISIKTA